jgi:hypothetical protein
VVLEAGLENMEISSTTGFDPQTVESVWRLYSDYTTAAAYILRKDRKKLHSCVIGSPD